MKDDHSVVDPTGMLSKLYGDYEEMR